MTLEKLDRRFRNLRPGSVLIFVVALLVLMALMGTAYITTARVDRYSAQQNSFNTEIDLLLQAVVQMEQDQIRTASNAPTDAAVGPSYHHWNSPSDENWWGSRVPVMMASNQPGWRFIAVSPTGTPFESPYTANGQVVTYTTRENLVTTSIPINVNGQIVQYPAFFDSSSGQTYLAASASGDGIADAGLWRIPIGELNGITYYAAVRVLDNNSALDASIAESRNAVAASLPGDFFPSNVDLQSLLVGGSGELAQLDQYRFNAASASLLPLNDSGNPMPFQFLSTYDAMWHQLGRRLDNPGWNVPSAKYQSLSTSDAMALAYRFCLTNSSASASVVEQALRSSLLNTPGNSKFVPTSAYSPDQVARWYTDNFAYESESPGSPATYLPRRALMAARTPVSNFAPNRYSDKGDFFSNPDSSAKPPQQPWNGGASYTYGDLIRYDNRSYVCIRDTVPIPIDPDAKPVVLATVRPPDSLGKDDRRNRKDENGNTILFDYSPLIWAPMPWINYPTRTGINTAQFAQLWLAFWNVMADSQSSVPAGTDTRMFRNPMRSAVAVTTTSNGNGNAPPSGGTIAVAPTGGDDTASIQAAINSSPAGSTLAFAGSYTISSKLNFLPDRTYTGGPGGGAIAGLSPYQTLQLRAALAAVNAEQLRNSPLSSANPNDVISRSISIGGASTPLPPTTGSATFNYTGPLEFFNDCAILQGNNITVEGINFIGGGLMILNGDSVNILNNSFSHSQNTIYFNTVSNSNISYNTFTNCNGTGIMSFPTNIIGCHFDWNTFTTINEGIHVNFGNGGASHNNTFNYNYVNGYTNCGIELQSVSTGGLKVMHNYITNPGGNNGGGHMALSIATGDDTTIPGAHTAGTEIGFNVCLGNASCMGSGAIENYGSGNNIHDNYIKQWYWGIPWNWTGLNGNVPWYITNNIFIGVTSMDSPEGYGTAAQNPPAVKNGNQVYPLGAGPPPPPPPVFSGSPDGSTLPEASDVALSYTISVFGSAPQPYITEAYGNNDPSTNGGYVAVELYNPYNVPIVMNNWRLATINRAVGTLFALVPSPLTSTLNWETSPPTIQPGGRLVLVSSDTTPSGATPPNPDSKSSVMVLPDLNAAMGQELVLLRPRRADGTLSWMTADETDKNADPALNHYDPTNMYDERTNLGDFVPLDSYDFTGLSASPGASGSYQWHYVRPNDPAQKAWHFVYPGKYNSADDLAANPALAPDSQHPRLVGTDVSPAGQGAISLASFGQPDLGQSNPANYQDAALQINNTDFGGATLTTFPHGGFARNGDILQTTYTGAYTIKVSSNLAIVEMNPITMDSAFADDPDMSKSATLSSAQNIGRFTPIHPADLGFGINDPAAPYNDYHPAGPMPAPNSGTDWSTKWSAYHFATRLFDFLTVQAPHDDYLPNISPTNPNGSANTLVQPVANSDPNIVNALQTNTPANATEDNVPLEGLININTAPWRVLSALPMANDAATNKQLAQAIVYFRDVDDGSLGPGNLHPHGPFQSLWELNAVPGFRTTLSTYADTFNPASSVPVNADGYYAFFARQTGGSMMANFAYNDFATQNLALTRISNLVTTRSDVFTVYVLVQGFRNAGTANPELMVQRRAAFIADRSRVIPSNLNLRILNVPTN